MHCRSPVEAAGKVVEAEAPVEDALQVAALEPRQLGQHQPHLLPGAGGQPRQRLPLPAGAGIASRLAELCHFATTRCHESTAFTLSMIHMGQAVNGISHAACTCLSHLSLPCRDLAAARKTTPACLLQSPSPPRASLSTERSSEFSLSSSSWPSLEATAGTKVATVSRRPYFKSTQLN